MTTFHLSPRGDDANEGQAARVGRGNRGPFATLVGGRDALRRLRESGELRGEATVLLHPGRYPLNELVEFGPQDGDTCYRAVKEGTVVIDGGEELAGFHEKTHKGLRAWVLDLPDIAAWRWYFPSLFVDGQRRPRARYPKFAPTAEGVKNVLRIGQLRFPEKRALFDGEHVFAPKPGDIQNWPSLPDAEVVVLHYWIDTRLGNPRYDPETGWIECARRSVFNLYESFNPKLARYYLDNLGDALSEPGEWYLDRRSGRLTYLPRPGEKLGCTRAVAPRLTRFLRVNGTAYGHGSAPLDPLGGRPVERLRFEGITFRHADWYQPQAEFLKHDRLGLEDRPLGSAPQGAAHVPSVIEFKNARDNVLARPKQEGIVGIGKVEDHVAATLCNNLLIGPAPLLYEGGYAGDVRVAFRTDANVLVFAADRVPSSGHPDFRKDVPRKISFKQWQSLGHDRRSLVMPIQFEESANSFRLPKNSPAFKTGFRLFDWSDCGPRIR
jgi:hypothetical protein